MAEILEGAGLPLVQRTATATGSSVIAFVSRGPQVGTFQGYMAGALLWVTQTAGTGNNSGNKFHVHLQGSMDNATWAELPHSVDIELTGNAAADFATKIDGPLPPYLRVVAEATGTPDATFSAYWVALA